MFSAQAEKLQQTQSFTNMKNTHVKTLKNYFSNVISQLHHTANA